MAKSSASNGVSQILEDVLLLAGNVASLGAALVSHRLQSTAGTANSFIRNKVDLIDIDKSFSRATARVEDAADYALHTDVKHMVDDVVSLARKYPVASVISVVAASVLAVRLLRPTSVVVTPSIKAVRKSASKAKSASKRAASKARVRAGEATSANG